LVGPALGMAVDVSTRPASRSATALASSCAPSPGQP
jgi:hypothetical protein